MSELDFITSPAQAFDFAAAMCQDLANERERMIELLRRPAGELVAEANALVARASLLRTRLAKVRRMLSPYKNGRRRNVLRPTFKARKDALRDRLYLLADAATREAGLRHLAAALVSCKYPAKQEVVT